MPSFETLCRADAPHYKEPPHEQAEQTRFAGVTLRRLVVGEDLDWLCGVLDKLYGEQGETRLEGYRSYHNANTAVQLLAKIEGHNTPYMNRVGRRKGLYAIAEELPSIHDPRRIVIDALQVAAGKRSMTYFRLIPSVADTVALRAEQAAIFDVIRRAAQEDGEAAIPSRLPDIMIAGVPSKTDRQSVSDITRVLQSNLATKRLNVMLQPLEYYPEVI